MDLTNIFVKTPKGVEEIEKRTHNLPLKLRSLLIMVNGKISAADLIGRGGTFGSGVEVLLKMLYEQGFIEPLSSARRQAVAPGTPVVDERRALESAKGVISKSLLDLLGPDAQTVVVKLERCSTKLQILTYCDTCKDIVESVAGKPKADEFWTRSRIAVDLAFSQAGPEVTRGPATLPPAAAPFDEKAALKEAQREIAKVLHNYLGPDADYVVQRLEKTTGKVQLLAFCDTCKDIVESVIGKTKGADVWNRSRQIIEKAYAGQVAAMTVAAATAGPAGPPTPPPPMPAAASGPPTIPPSGPPTVPPWLHQPGADGVKALKATKQGLSKALLDIMGPEADFLLVRLEKAKDLAELLNLATSCRNLVADTRGRNKGEAFWATVRQFYPDEA